MVLAFLTAGIVVLIDQIVKCLSMAHLVIHTSYPMIDGLFELYYLQNKGAGWGILHGQLKLFYVMTPIIMFYIIYLIYKQRNQSKWVLFALGLLLGGALGNFIDRVIHGYVVDMIRVTFIDFPVFNVADMALSIGVVILIIIILLDKEGDLL